MKRSTIVLVIAGSLIGLLGGFLWWGMPARRLTAEVQDTRASAERLAQQLEDLRNRHQELGAQLKAQTTRLEATERDLHTEKEMNSRLHLLVGHGQK